MIDEGNSVDIAYFDYSKADPTLQPFGLRDSQHVFLGGPDCCPKKPGHTKLQATSPATPFSGGDVIRAWTTCQLE